MATATAASANTSGWLSISQEGFASMNRDRPAGHLAKEIVQNALDAIDQNGKTKGRITIYTEMMEEGCLFSVQDDGIGMTDLLDIRKVFWTSKTDSHRKRGRMGRGFKEMLCLANSCRVISEGKVLRFDRDEDGIPLAPYVHDCADKMPGTLVKMYMPWTAEESEEVVKYLSRTLVPNGMTMEINGKKLRHRQAAYNIKGRLPTETFDTDGHKWKKPMMTTNIRLVPVKQGEKGFIYEMGIPVCPIGWNVQYHADIQQRVPMNPNRDAVQTGYESKVHKICLPQLIDLMDEEQASQDWVGAAVKGTSDETKRKVVEKVFGAPVKQLVRSVPEMGTRSHDDDAKDLGKKVINSQHSTGGMRDVLREMIPSSKVVVDIHEKNLSNLAKAGAMTVTEFIIGLDSPDNELRAKSRAIEKLIEKAGGSERVDEVLGFCTWFCQILLDTARPDTCGRIKSRVANLTTGHASWSEDDRLTLSLSTDYVWQSPLSHRTLSLLIHEAAHHNAFHHGYNFHQEIEYLSGFAAEIMFQNKAQIIEQFADLLEE